jgi:hypothetical protein
MPPLLPVALKRFYKARSQTGLFLPVSGITWCQEPPLRSR